MFIVCIKKGVSFTDDELDLSWESSPIDSSAVLRSLERYFKRGGTDLVKSHRNMHLTGPMGDVSLLRLQKYVQEKETGGKSLAEEIVESLQRGYEINVKMLRALQKMAGL